MKRKYFGIMALSLALICSSVTATVTSAYEPDRAKASYATPAKANVDEKNMSHIGNYSYCLIRNKTAAKIYVNNGTEKTGVIPTKINGIPVKEIGCVDSDVKWEKLIVSDGIEVIDAKAFMGLSHLKEICIGKDVEYIGEYAFPRGRKLTKITGGQNIKFLGRGAFAECYGITKLPAFVKTNKNCVYGQAIFMKAKGLRNVVVPPTMKYTVATFKNCDQLKTARVEGVGYKPNKQKWKTMTNTAVNRAMFKNCRKLQKVTLTNNITHLNEQIFANCIRLKKVNIPTQCRYIGEGAFLNCKSLQKVTVSKKCKVIGKSAFLRCSNLKKVNIPKGCRTIGPLAFGKCKNLRSLYVPKTVKNIDQWAFYGSKNLTLTVDKGSTAEKFAKKYGMKYRYKSCR